MSRTSTPINAFGEDSPLDLSLQIEIVRGPASALYGSGGVLATINIITEAPRDASPEVRVETDSLGEKKIQATSPLALGKNATMLFPRPCSMMPGSTIFTSRS